MIKRAVIGHLIQWSSHSWYDILFLCNYAAPTTPHVFIASSTHVKLKSSLCTWYLIIACCTARAQWGKCQRHAIYRTWSSNRQATITEQHSCTHAETLRYEFEHWGWMGTLSGLSLLSWFLYLFVRVREDNLEKEIGDSNLCLSGVFLFIVSWEAQYFFKLNVSSVANI